MRAPALITGPMIIRAIFRSAHRKRRDLRLQLLEELIVDRIVDNRPRARRALLPLISERRLHHARDGAIEIGLAIHNDRVLAAHLRHHALDPDLPLARLRGQFIDAQAHVARAGEGNEARLGMLDQQIADDRAAARAQRQTARRESGLVQHLDKLRGDGRAFRSTA